MYDYHEAMRKDLIDCIAENMNLEELIQEVENESLPDTLQDIAWEDDGVTGNASGSYTFNSWKAREYVLDNVDVLSEAVEDICIEPEAIGEHFIAEDWEWFDVIIRCYVLSEEVWKIQEDLTACLDALKAETKLSYFVLSEVLKAA